MCDHNFEKQVQQKLDELKVPPADTVWTSVEAQIRKDKRRRRGIIFFPILLLLIGTGFYFIFQNKLSSVNDSRTNSVSTNSGSDNNNGDISDKSKTEQELIIKDGMQDNVNNSTKQPDIKETPEKQGSGPDASGNKTDQQKVDHNTTTDNTPASNLQSGSTKYANRKPTLKKNNTNPDKKKTQQDLITHQQKNDRDIARKDQAPATDAKQQEEAIISRDKELVSVPDSQANKIADNAGVNRIADSIGENDLTQVQPEDSISSRTIIEEKETAVKKTKQSNWKWGLIASAGISNLSDRGFFNSIGGEKAFVADFSPIAYNNVQGNPSPSAIIYKPSVIEKGFSFSAGSFIQKNISKKFSISTGLQYSYYSTHIRVGARIDSSAILQNTFGSLNVDQFYRSAPFPATHEYTNRFHFLELPVLIHAQLNKSNRLPLFWNAGLSLSYLVSTNALHFDSRTGVYYKDNGLFNKLQTSLSTGFSVSLWNASRMPVHIGPQLQYGLTSFMKHDVTASKHLFHFGFSAKVFLKK